MSKKTDHIGIDLGGKTTSNTVGCYTMGEKLLFTHLPPKNQHQHLLKFCLLNSFETVFMDAPLSLPGIYSGKKGFHDFHHRKCDLELKAMSPMYLGGFTASAIELKAHMEGLHIKVWEVYPKALIQELGLQQLYSKKITPTKLAALLNALKPHHMGFKLSKKPATIHELDAFLAWLSGHRFQQGIHQTKGDAKEGIILI